MEPCGAYCRYSHDDGDESESVALQMERAKQIADAHGWRLEKKFLFTDDGISGREMKRRPGFTACLDAVSRRAFPVLIVRDLDRFARGEVFHVGTALQRLIDNDVRLFEYIKNGGTGEYLKTEGENALMVSFRAYANRQEALKASERIKDKLLARDEANDGWTGPTPFGFRNVRRRLSDGKVGIFLDRKGTVGDIERDPDEYPVLVLMAELFLKLGSYNAVAMELNKRRIRSPSGGAWQSRTVAKIIANEVYRGRVTRGRTMSTDKGGTLAIVPAPPDAVRTYPRPELRVWSPEMESQIDALIEKRSRTTTWSVGERKHLASSCVRCSHCGKSISVNIGGKGYPSYCCTNTRVGACRKLGYRPKHKVDEAVILAAGMLLTDDVLAKTKAIISETLDIKRQADARELELDRLSREVAASKRRLQNLTDAVAEAPTRELRAPLMQSMENERKRLVDLQDALARAQASSAPADEKTVLEQLEARVDELRAGLAQGGVAALPTVQALLGEERLDATRRPDGRWDLSGTGHPIRVFHGKERVVEVGPKQKQKIKGTLSPEALAALEALAGSASGAAAPVTAHTTAPAVTSTPVVAAPAGAANGAPVNGAAHG